jgi:hypothetical protein
MHENNRFTNVLNGPACPVFSNHDTIFKNTQLTKPSSQIKIAVQLIIGIEKTSLK